MENEKKSPASHHDVSERNRINDDSRAPHPSTGDRAMFDGASEARVNLSEHLRIGAHFSHVVETAVARYTAENGNTPLTRQHALDAAYLFLEKEFGRSRAAVRLYIRCYQRFADLAERHTLTFKDMVMHLGSNPAAI